MLHLQTLETVFGPVFGQISGFFSDFFQGCPRSVSVASGSVLGQFSDASGYFSKRFGAAGRSTTESKTNFCQKLCFVILGKRITFFAVAEFGTC